jgi:23S rRNA (cytidine1920-2'-O)/16S rRNA (cytidine1409-2'-O)-methyltransferase
VDFVSRGGIKLDHALSAFGIDVERYVCADLGCSTGGFTDCLLKRGAARVYAVDTGYGVLDYRLRTDARVVVRERSNAMHVELPERVDLVVIDCAWTRQKHVLPAAKRLLNAGGQVVTLVKPHYEADPKLLRKGILPQDQVEPTVNAVLTSMAVDGFVVRDRVESPIKGSKGNVEVLAWLSLS